MDHAEEQEQEREALAAIFLDDYTPLSDDGRRLQLALSHPAAGVAAKLVVTLPPTYPEAPPAVSLHPGSGLTAPRRAALLAALDAEAAAQVGMPMIFGLHSFAMDWLQANVAGGEADEEEDDCVGVGTGIGTGRGLGGGSTFETREEVGADDVGCGGAEGSGGGADARGDRVAAKAYGTPVTVESFTAWSAAFEAEMAAARAAAAAAAAKAAGAGTAGEAKLTGRQLFELNKAVGVEDDSESFWEAEAESELAAS